jgi:hypothetical protein
VSHTQGPTQYSAIEIFLKGRELAAIEHQKGEAAKLGTLRAGSSGALIGEHVIGKCHRLSLARYLGLSEPHDDHTHTIFESGYANEEVWLSKVRLGWTGKVTGDKDYPISWEMDGKKVTGRPDLVFLDTDDKPQFGVELKVVESIQSATSLYFENKPKTDNLIQAAHYSLKFNLPWTLVYTFSGIGEPPYWAIKKFGIPKGFKLKPFKLEFKLLWKDGQLGYLDKAGNETMTNVTEDSINDYFQLLVDMDREKDLYLRHSSQDFQGKGQGWSSCDYCSAKNACDSYDQHGDFELWKDELERDWSTK